MRTYSELSTVEILDGLTLALKYEAANRGDHSPTEKAIMAIIDDIAEVVKRTHALQESSLSEQAGIRSQISASILGVD